METKKKIIKINLVSILFQKFSPFLNGNVAKKKNRKKFFQKI